MKNIPLQELKLGLGNADLGDRKALERALWHMFDGI